LTSAAAGTMSLSGLSLGLAPLEKFARNTAFAFGKNGRQFTFASPQHRQGSSAANLDNVWNPDLWKPTATANDHLIDGKVVKPTEEVCAMYSVDLPSTKSLGL